MPQAPQLALSVCTLMHVPAHSKVPDGQAQTLDWHVLPPAQAFPQTPQLVLLEVSDTHVPLQSVMPAGH
jgi:hypothetical protein